MSERAARRSRVLFVRLSALGDVIHVLPSLAALKEARPEAFVGFAVEARAASLLEGHPQIDRLHVIPRASSKAGLAFATAALRARRELRREQYDVAIDFQSNFRSALVTRLAGARRTIGQPRPYAKEGAWFLEGEQPAPVPREVHKIERNLRLLSVLGIAPARPPRPVIPEPASSRAAAEAFAARGRRPLILIHPGVSKFGALKAWREEGFAAVARRLGHLGARVAITWGGADERALAERIARDAGNGVEVAPPSGTVLDLAAILKRADLFLGVDSGPLHLASAVGAPCVGLYGPKDPRTYGPYWPNGLPVRKGVPCSPCTLRRCPRNECMTLLTAPEVLRAVDAMLVTAAFRHRLAR